MNDAETSILWALPGPSRLTGPIFDKELRVSSRRRRSYVLRSAYILLLSMFILYAWLATVNLGGGGGVFQISRMARVGKNVITAIIWFQFIAAQLIAMVMLSTSISSEIRQGTLGVLLTTPINSIQIVMGKLLSRLLQTVLLLAISLPLLAIMRVLGGVPWDYVVSSLCITLTAAIFAGSLSLFMSIRSKQAYAVVLTIVVGYLIVFGALPGLIAFFGLGARGFVEHILSYCNPFMMMVVRTYAMLSLPGRTGVSPSVLLHCGIMLVATACVVSLALLRVRRIVLSEAFEGGAESGRVGREKWVLRRRMRRAALPIRRVDDPPIVWKEMRKVFSRRGRRDAILYALSGGIIFFGLVLSLFRSVGGPNLGFAMLFYVMQGFLWIAIVRLAVLSASSITVEREARTWPILLATPLEDSEIVRGKAVAAFRRSLPLLVVFILLHFGGWLLGTLGGASPVYSLLYLIREALSLAGVVVLIIGLGLYFSVRMRSTNAAVAATVGVYFGLCFLCCGMFVPMPLYSLVAMGGGFDMSIYLLVQVVLAAISSFGYAGVGILALRGAKRRLRYNVF